jgi:hypothetical protein
VTRQSPIKDVLVPDLHEPRPVLFMLPIKHTTNLAEDFLCPCAD